MESVPEEIRQLKKAQYIVLFGSIFTSVVNPLYHIYLTRTLGPELYGHFYLLISFLSIAIIPSITLQTMVAGTVAQLRASNFIGLKEFVHQVFPKIFLVGWLVTFLFLFFHTYLAEIFYLPNHSSLILLGFTFPFAFILPLFIGGLQGLQLFSVVSFISILEVASRFLLSVIFLQYGFKETAAIFAFLLGNLFTSVLAYFFLKQHFSSQSCHSPIRSHYFEHFFLILGTLISFSTISQLDMLYVKHFFPEEAGFYATASFIGKSLILIPIPYIIVMVPKVSALVQEKQTTFYIGGHVTLVIVFVCSVISMAFLFTPSHLIQMIFGEKFIQILPYLQLFGFAMTPLAAISVLIYYNIARRQTFCFPFVFCWLLLLLFALIGFRLTPIQSLIFYAVSGAFLFTLLFLKTFKNLEPREPFHIIFDHFLPVMVLRKIFRFFWRK